MKKKIFFSYALRDKNINMSFLIELRNWVLHQGYDCYIDFLDNDYNENGFQKQLIRMLKTCDVFFRIDSEEYLASKWAKKELEEAEANNIQIVSLSSEQLQKAMLNNGSIAEYL